MFQIKRFFGFVFYCVCCAASRRFGSRAAVVLGIAVALSRLASRVAGGLSRIVAHGFTAFVGRFRAPAGAVVALSAGFFPDSVFFIVRR